MNFGDKAKNVPDSETCKLKLEELTDLVLGAKFSITPRTDERFLTKFLRTKNYKVDKAFRSVKGYYANVKRNLDYIEGIRPSHFAKTFNQGPIMLFKHRSNGRRVGYCHGCTWNPKEMTLRDIQLSIVLITEYVLNEEETQDNGVVIILDCSESTWEQWKYITPREIMRTIITALEGLPLKISEIHIIKPNRFVWAIYYVWSKIVKKKLLQRIHLHDKMGALFDFIDPQICPVTLGGELSVEEAKDKEYLDAILQHDVPYEDLWNGEKTRIELMSPLKI